VRVDVGLAGAMRRLLQGAVPRPWLEDVSAWVKPRVIPWHMFDLVEIDPARRVKLQITYKALSRLHPADAADIMEELAPAERQSVFQSLDSQVAADILGEVSPRLQRTLLEGVDKEKAADILEEMDPDQAADLLSGLPAERSEEILQDMEAEERDEVTELLEYPERTAGGHMTTDYVALRDTATVADAVAALQEFEGPVESINTLLLVNGNEHLTSVVPVARILLAQSSTPLQQLGVEAVTIPVDANEDEIAETFDKYNLLALPVVDEERRLLGVITVDDVIALLRRASS
jgi:Mg/Co/Ni transporter MgtE